MQTEILIEHLSVKVLISSGDEQPVFVHVPDQLGTGSTNIKENGTAFKNELAWELLLISWFEYELHDLLQRWDCNSALKQLLFDFQDQQAQNDVEEMLKKYESYRWQMDPLEQLECILLSEFWSFVERNRPSGKPYLKNYPSVPSRQLDEISSIISCLKIFKLNQDSQSDGVVETFFIETNKPSE